jgi:regulatory protein
MKITDIKQQVKRQDRYSIYIDGKYVFSYGESELLQSGLHIGKELTAKELEEQQGRAAVDKAYDRALRYLAIRMRSEWELRQYLKRKDYDDPLIDQILNMLSNRGMVDDLKFAHMWVDNRHLLKTISRRRLQQELRQKRISDDIIQQVLQADETDERTELRALVEKKRQISRFQDDLKLMQYLSRQGYNYDDIKAALQPED